MYALCVFKNDHSFQSCQKQCCQSSCTNWKQKPHSAAMLMYYQMFDNLTPPVLKGLFIQNVNSGITISPSYQLKFVQFLPLSEKGYVAECPCHKWGCANEVLEIQWRGIFSVNLWQQESDNRAYINVFRCLCSKVSQSRSWTITN